MREQGIGKQGTRNGKALFLLGGVVTMALSVQAFAPVPTESATALKVTRGKSFSTGAVFINGKYLEPPYVVERWGTGIRINGKPVTGQVIDWNAFLKTQAGVKVEKRETGTRSVGEVPEGERVDASSLDDLFDDESKPEKPSVSKSSRPVVAAKPRVVEVCSLEGEFVPNDATKAMVSRINASRTEIDRTLRKGGFICFGDSYSQVAGDSRTLLTFLEKLPDIQRRATGEQDFCERVRKAGLIYLNEVLRMDLYRNRGDYRKLQERCAKLKKDSDMQKILDEVSTPLL